MESLGLVNASIRSPISEQEFMRYRVNGTDTLLGIALKLGSSVSELKLLNGLSGDDLWFKKDLIIPKREYSANASEMIAQAEESCRTAHIARLTAVPSSIARYQLRRCNDSLDDATVICQNIGRLGKAYDVSPDVVVECMEASRYDTHEAEEILKDDYQQVGCQSFCGLPAMRHSGDAAYRPLRQAGEEPEKESTVSTLRMRGSCTSKWRGTD